MLGEAGLSLVSGGVVFIIISHLSGPELLGTYALAVAWLILFQGVGSFGIPEFLMREVGVHGRAAAGHVLHAMVLGLGSGAAAVLLMLAAVRLMGYSPYLVRVCTIASLALIPAFLGTACRAVFLALREMHLAFLAMLVEVVVMMSATLYLLLSGYGAIALMVAVVAAKITSASIALVLLRRRVLPAWPSFDLGFLVRTAKPVFTFGVGGLLAMLTMRVNMILASGWVNIVSLGHFAAATKITEIGMIVPSLFAQLLTSRIAYSFNIQGNRDPNLFGAWYRVLFAFLVPTCVGLWVFAELILDTLFGAGFGKALWVLRILLIYLLIESVDAVMSIMLRAVHRQRADVGCLVFNPLTNIALTLLLLPTLGTIGAAIGRVGGTGASATLRYLLISRDLKRVNWLRFALKPVLISIGTGAVCCLFLDVRRPAWLLLYAATNAVLLMLSSSFSFTAIKDLMSFPPARDEPGIGKLD